MIQHVIARVFQYNQQQFVMSKGRIKPTHALRIVFCMILKTMIRKHVAFIGNMHMLIVSFSLFCFHFSSFRNKWVSLIILVHQIHCSLLFNHIQSKHYSSLVTLTACEQPLDVSLTKINLHIKQAEWSFLNSQAVGDYKKSLEIFWNYKNTILDSSFLSL